MAVTVFLFIFLLGGVAGNSNSIDDLVAKVESKCRDTGTSATTCQNFANQFRGETARGPGCASADANSVYSTYSATISALSPTSDKNKMLLWSGDGMGYKARMESSKKSLDKTTAGESLYGIHWTKDARGSIKWQYTTDAKFTYCSKECPHPMEDLFWGLASLRFAAQAKGEVEVYLTDKTGRPYPEKSFFRQYEVPNLKGGREKVTKLTVKLFDSGHCKSANMKQLEADLEKNGISSTNNNYFCYEAGTSELADTGNLSVAGFYWRPDGTYCDSCMKLPSVITIIIPILTLLLKS